MPVVGQGAAELDIVSILPSCTFHIQIGFADRKCFRIDLLAKKEDIRLRAFSRYPPLGYSQHTAGAAAGVIYGANDALPIQFLLIRSEDKVDH